MVAGARASATVATLFDVVESGQAFQTARPKMIDPPANKATHFPDAITVHPIEVAEGRQHEFCQVVGHRLGSLRRRQRGHVELEVRAPSVSANMRVGISLEPLWTIAKKR
jgi:hypothetical protein